eukprot:XP_016662901.1 PREDICTED: kelch-like protein 3 [Acyrthosiphon pisum]
MREGLNYTSLKSVECYDPSLDTWTPVTDIMSSSRLSPGLGVLCGVIYAVGSQCQEYTDKVILKSIEAYTPIAKVWSPIPDMHICRFNPSNMTNGGFKGSKKSADP